MNLGTLIGLILGTSLIGLAAFLSASATGISLLALYDTVSLLIVVGGSIAATAIAFKMKDVVRLFGLLKMIFKDDGFTLGDVVDDLCDLAESNRRGRKDFESALQSTPQSMKFRMHMVRDGAELILGGTKIDDIEEIMENMEAYREQREMQEMNVMKSLGVYAPAFGMVGTLIGLVFMLQGMGQPAPDGVDPQAQMGQSMAVALITTLYGALFANFLFLPFADKLKGKNEDKKVQSALITAGMLLIAQKVHPLQVREKLNAYLPPKMRKKPEDE
tara:strand:+ start:572 stop:1393 length:822 start_codon:yes stop_codon:yes gene_type:complete